MRPWFSLKLADEDFFTTAPNRDVGVFEISQPAAQVWGALVADDTLHWCRALSDVSWTSPRPFAVGTTRTAKTPLSVLVLKETFFRWEEGRRMSFYVQETTLPIFNRFAEDYLVEETSPTSCRFTWTVAAEPSTAGKPGGPLNGLINRSLFSDTRRHFNIA